MKHAVFILAVLLMAGQGMAINNTYTWDIGGPQLKAADGTLTPVEFTDAKPLCLAPGDCATFEWTNTVAHDVYNTTATGADICTAPTASELVPVATSGKYTICADIKGPGKFGILCTVGRHCEAGKMSAVIDVKATGTCP